MISPAKQPAAVSQDARIYVALELSGSKWVVAIQSPLSSKLGRHAIEARDKAALKRLLDQARQRVKAKFGEAEVISCYEAGYDGFWLHHWLTGQEVTNRVLDPASIQVDRRRRRPKTDRLDVEQLIRVLMALWRGERRVCRPVRVPSEQEEDSRRLLRERERLIKERVQHVNRIKGLLNTQGIGKVEPLAKAFLQHLPELRTGNGRPLLPGLRGALEREHRRLALVEEQLKALERVLLERQRGAEGEHASKVRQLQSLKSIGPIGAQCLVDEVFHRDFANRREVGGYFGLAPTPFSSGGMQREQGISKTGTKRARAMAIELGWLWLRHQPGSALSKWFVERVGTAKGRIRRIAIAALARKLMIALWRFLTTGLIPDGAVLKASAAPAA